MQYTAENVLVRPSTDPQDQDLILTVTPHSAGWDFISFQARRLSMGHQWSFNSNENELAIVILSGAISVKSNRGSWEDIERENVWTSAATALYLPRGSDFTITAVRDSEFAVTWVPTDEDHEPWLIQPQDVSISIRGGDNVSRQINDLLPPGSLSSTLMTLTTFEQPRYELGHVALNSP